MTDRKGRKSNPVCCAVYAGKNTAKPRANASKILM
jgi:hypothetical protein